MPTTSPPMKTIIEKALFALAVLMPVAAHRAQAMPPCDDKKECRMPQGIQPPRDGKNFDPEQFKRELTNFITREAGLTAAEARAFLPVYFEMKEKQRNLEHQKGRSLRAAAEKNMSNRDCKRVLSELAELEKKALRIENQYMQRLEALVGAQKLVKAIDADRKFGRHAFKQMVK